MKTIQSTQSAHTVAHNACRRLLILSCSQRKVQTPGAVAALQRYDGPAYRVLRRYLREVNDPLLDIRVLSAKFGIISSNDAIDDYDKKMDGQRADELHDSSVRALRLVFSEIAYSEVFVCMSRTYQMALQGIDQLHSRVQFAVPGQGRKLAHLKSWLYNM